MTKEWNTERKHEQYYKMAKKNKYRSRASYKLKQINKRFKLIKPGSYVLDLGAAPGGWSQIALEIIGGEGLVVGVDLQRIRPFEEENFIRIRGDFTSEEIQKKIVRSLEGKANIVLSDASPKLSGIKDMDNLKAAELAETVLKICDSLLERNGSLIMKVFQGVEFQNTLKKIKKQFRNVKTTKPDSSRKKSTEMYVVAKGFRGPSAKKD